MYRGDSPRVKTWLQGQSTPGFDRQAKKDCAFGDKHHALGHKSEKKDTKVTKRKPVKVGSFYNLGTKDHNQHSRDVSGLHLSLCCGKQWKKLEEDLQC